MRLLLLAVFALGAYGQRPFPPDNLFPPEIVPSEVFARHDPLKIDPKHYRLDYENEHVRAIRLTLKADEAVPMHDDVDALAVCIQECHLRFTWPNGHIQDVHMESGETRWLYGDTHSTRNLNTNPMEMLFIEVKSANKDR
jgi:beta-alanine degradation protein BauB